MQSTRRETFWDLRLERLIKSMDLYPLTQIKGRKGSLHPFVSGLLLSSSIMEELNRVIHDNLRLGWGQILSEDDTLSGEIDIMAFHGKPLYHWDNVGFSIVNKDNVEFIIEVKGWMSSYKGLESAFSGLSEFCQQVFLIIFQTSNRMNKIISRAERLKQFGFKDVFHIIRWEKNGDSQSRACALYEDWYRLMKFI